MTSNRRLFVHAAIALAASVVGIIACSSDRHPAALDGPGTTSSSGATGTVTSSSTSGAASSSSSGTVDPDASSSSSSGEVDSGPPFECIGEKSLSEDGGALPTSCPESASCASHCTSIANHYKLGTAQRAIACIKKLPSCNANSDVQACVDKAMGDTCEDSTSPAYCAPLVTPCDPNAGQPGSSIDEVGCEIFAKSLNASGRTAFSDCIKQKISDGDCPIQVVACASDIRL